MLVVSSLVSYFSSLVGLYLINLLWRPLHISLNLARHSLILLKSFKVVVEV